MKINNKRSLICITAAIVNLILFFTKLYVAISSNSISIYVDSLNSLSDTFVCAIGVAGFYIAAMSPNKKYPFGYGKSEELVNLLLSVVILFTGAAFVYTSLQRFMYPVPVWFSVKYAVIIGITAAVKLIMALFFKAMNRKNPSNVIKNLEVDSTLDFLVSLCIVISFTLTNYVGYSVDSVTGIVTSVVIIVLGFKSLCASCATLMGKRNAADCFAAEKIISENKYVKHIENVQCHIYGERKIYTAEIVFNCDGSALSEAVSQLRYIINNELGSELYISIGGNNQ